MPVIQDSPFWARNNPPVRCRKMEPAMSGRAQEEAVNHPSHYNAGEFEVIEVIDDWQLGFYEGNIIKYVGRAKYKGKELQDLKKALWYLERLVTLKEKEAASGE